MSKALKLQRDGEAPDTQQYKYSGIIESLLYLSVRKTRECHYCHKVGHIKRNCWRYQQEVLGQKGPKIIENGNNAFAASSFSAVTAGTCLDY
jgi:hypothetical protein